MRILALAVAVIMTLVSCFGGSAESRDEVMAPEGSFVENQFGKTFVTEANFENQSGTIERIWASFSTNISVLMAFREAGQPKENFRCVDARILSFEDSADWIEIDFMFFDDFGDELIQYEGVIRFYSNGQVELDWTRNGSWAELDSWNYVNKEEICLP